MNELEIFKNEEFGTIRTIQLNKEPYFCMTDICRALELGNVSQALTRINKDGVISNEVIDSLGRKQKANFINESNMYKLIFQSRKESAEKFSDWVTNEVLPTIRKTGGYVNDDELFVNTYLPFADQQTKSMFWQTLHTIRKQNEQITKQKEQLEHKQEIINGFCDIDVYTKRTIINRICKRTSTNNFATRWLELYHCFKETYHIDLSTRYHSYNIGKSNKDKCSSIIEYAELFGHIDNLYKCCVTLYEAETKKILQQIVDAKGAK